VKLTEDLAGLRVRVALGRPPQDQLEATVVLESWGVSSDLAFTVAGPDTQAAPMLCGGRIARSNEPPTCRTRWRWSDFSPG